MYIPKEPNMLLSFINLKLRDEYNSLNELCKSLDVNEEEITEKLKNINYHYDINKNSFTIL